MLLFQPIKWSLVKDVWKFENTLSKLRDNIKIKDTLKDNTKIYTYKTQVYQYYWWTYEDKIFLTDLRTIQSKNFQFNKYEIIKYFESYIIGNSSVNDMSFNYIAQIDQDRIKKIHQYQGNRFSVEYHKQNLLHQELKDYCNGFNSKYLHGKKILFILFYVSYHELCSSGNPSQIPILLETKKTFILLYNHLAFSIQIFLHQF